MNIWVLGPLKSTSSCVNMIANMLLDDLHTQCVYWGHVGIKCMCVRRCVYGDVCMGEVEVQCVSVYSLLVYALSCDVKEGQVGRDREGGEERGDMEMRHKWKQDS